MTEEETVRAIVTGIELVRECKEKDTVSLPPGKWESATRLPAVR